MEKTIKAELILENGIKFYGNAFGYIKETVGESSFHNWYDWLSGNTY